MRRLIAVLFTMSFALVACGGGSTTSATGSSAAGSASASGSTAETGSGGEAGEYGNGGGAGTEAESTGEVAGTITISSFAYGDPLTVAPGALVAVVNQDPQQHSATAEDASFDTGLIGQGAQATFTAPSAAGTYNIMCTAHPQMSGQLIVSG